MKLVSQHPGDLHRELGCIIAALSSCCLGGFGRSDLRLSQGDVFPCVMLTQEQNEMVLGEGWFSLAADLGMKRRVSCRKGICCYGAERASLCSSRCDLCPWETVKNLRVSHTGVCLCEGADVMARVFLFVSFACQFMERYILGFIPVQITSPQDSPCVGARHN